MDSGQRPTAMILGDPYAGHRDYYDPWWLPDERSNEWTDWDFALVNGLKLLESTTDRETGQPRWMSEDPDVRWEYGLRVNWAQKDLDSVRKQYEKDSHVTPYLKNPSKDGEFWSYEEWLEHVSADEHVIERGQPQGARPPTAAELAAMRERREARKAAAEN